MRRATALALAGAPAIGCGGNTEKQRAPEEAAQAQDRMDMKKLASLQ